MTTMAEHFARRIHSVSNDPAEQIRAAIPLALARPARADEVKLLSAYSRRHGLPNACRLILNLNEFVFVE